MIRDICNAIYQNKNILMLVTVCIYILSLFSVLAGNSLITAGIISIFLALLCIKNFFPAKLIIIWCLIFYIGIINTNIRIKATDDLRSIAPVNATLYGKVLTIPQIKDNNKQKFFFNVDKIEYNGITENLRNEKVLVTLNSDQKLGIYNSYKIRGRLSLPFKSGNPSQFDYGNYLRNYNTYAVFYGHNPYSMRNLPIPCFEQIETEPTLLEAFLQKINNYREGVINIHSEYLKSPNLEILGGIVFGDDAVSAPEEIKQSFINSGLLHILAASGMNVAFIFSFFFFLLNLFRINYKVNISICIIAVIIYVFMTGLGPSIVRAALMLLFVLIGKLIDRDAHSISLLSFVAFLMLLYNPMYINDVGFQLSFVVTFGLLAMTPSIIRSQSKIINWIVGTICVPIIAQIWVIPIQIFYFNNISIYSIFANIMSVPILSVISFGGFISSLICIITPISHLVCKVFDCILNPLITTLINISDFWGNLPNSTIQTSHPHIIQVLMYYCIILILIGLLNKDTRQKYAKIFVSFLIILTSIFFISVIPIKNSNLEITAFDVGNADAFMIKTPENKYILIDTGKSGYNNGKSQAEMIILKYLIDNNIKTIDSIIITHFDNDHCGGAADLINNIKVNNIYVNSLEHNSASAKIIYDAAKSRNTNIILAKNKQQVFKNNNLEIENLFAGDTPGIGDNESSILTILRYNKFSMLFTGDAGVETYNKLRKYLPQDITVLKVGHHGAAGVINKDIASYLNPKYSIFSTGENKFGHPSVYTLETLRSSEILSTDTHNSIKIVVTKDKNKIFIFDSIKHKYILYKS